VVDLAPLDAYQPRYAVATQAMAEQRSLTPRNAPTYQSRARLVHGSAETANRKCSRWRTIFGRRTDGVTITATRTRLESYETTGPGLRAGEENAGGTTAG